MLHSIVNRRWIVKHQSLLLKCITIFALLMVIVVIYVNLDANKRIKNAYYSYSLEQDEKEDAIVKEGVFRTRIYRKMLQRLSYQECLIAKQQSKSLGGYCLPEDLRAAKNAYYPFDTSLANAIYELVIKEGDSLTDLGCGPGHYGEYWLKKARQSGRTFYYRGMDGAANVDTITDGFVDYLDLTERAEDQYLLWNKNSTYWDARHFGSEEENRDKSLHPILNNRETLSKSKVVMSLEVLEHVPKSEEIKVVDNVLRLAEDRIILSWAIPKQGGQHHVNERSNQYVLKLMQDKYGLKYCETISKQLRQKSTLAWFKNTIFVFSKIHHSVDCY